MIVAQVVKHSLLPCSKERAGIAQSV